MADTNSVVAERIEVTGLVQGVGFRPFAHRLAGDLGLSGTVSNDRATVVIHVTGRAEAIDEFASRLEIEAPPLSSIDGVRRSSSSSLATPGFSIAPSTDGHRSSSSASPPRIPPDVAICDDCLAELFDPDDRRHRHPLITCTNCGPRYTIIRTSPYDRANTTMAGFELCSHCRSEYEDPANRRHHAQTISCHDCGPKLSFRSSTGSSSSIEDDPIAAAVEYLATGSILAVKGVGGYHLACDATDDAAVASLRRRKARPDKPLAVMVRSVEEAMEVAEVTDDEAELLLSAARPIVLVRARSGSPVSTLVAPGSPIVGLLLAYTPIQHLLLAGLGRPLVMTSGNRSGEPIVHRDRDVGRRLGNLCDGVLANDRPIHQPCDDSVARIVDGSVLPIRRSRGYTPLPIPFPMAEDLLAIGGDLKNTFCVASGGNAWISQHFGDLGELATESASERARVLFSDLLDTDPVVVAHDRHPGYRSSAIAERLGTTAGITVVSVQHHHAHVASVLAEHQISPERRVIGFAFDGTGYGDDGTIWGSEVMLANASGFRREGHLMPVVMAGGDAAIRQPWRAALAHLHAAGVDWDEGLAPVARLGPDERQILRKQLESGFGCIETTSMGRLFDAVASLMGLRQEVSFEGQAAIDLELLAETGRHDRGYRLTLSPGGADPGPMLQQIVDELKTGVRKTDIAASFHSAVARFVTGTATELCRKHDVDTVVLTGGVFQNARLLSQCRSLLSGRGFEVLTNSSVPPNDGGIALGQAYVAAARQSLAQPSGTTDSTDRTGS